MAQSTRKKKIPRKLHNVSNALAKYYIPCSFEYNVMGKKEVHALIRKYCLINFININTVKRLRKF